MKKNILFYLLGLIAITFSSCDPLDDTIAEVKPNDDYIKTINITSTTTYPSKALANEGIVAMLEKSYAQLSNGSKANVTYTYRTNTVKPADSVYANTLYTVTDADYGFAGGTFKTFTDAQVLSFLDFKYPLATSPANKLVLLSYKYFQSGVTSSAGIDALDAFFLFESGWKKINLVTPAQYASVGRGTTNIFVSADVANLPVYFNNFLKADATVMATAKVGDVRYITYKYYQSSSISHQKVYMLTFDGTNWAPSTTLSFIKKNGKWIPDPTIYYTLLTNDYIDIADNAPATVGNTANRANLKSFKNFNIVVNQATTWADTDVNNAIIYILNKKYASATADPTIEYNITYTYYNGSTRTGSKVFIKEANGFTFVKTIL